MKRKHTRLFLRTEGEEPAQGWILITRRPGANVESAAVTAVVDYLKPRIPSFEPPAKRVALSRPDGTEPDEVERATSTKATSVNVYDSGCKQMLVVGFPRGADPVELAEELLEAPDVAARAARLLESVDRVIPVQVFCEASLEALAAALKPLLDASINQEANPSSYLVDFKTRNNQSLERNPLYEKVRELVDAHHEIAFKNPVYCIQVEVLKQAAALTIYKPRPTTKNWNIQTATKRAAALEAPQSSS